MKTDIIEPDEERKEDEEKGEICPYCDGTNISPYERDGGSCPHCFGGHIK